MAFWGIEVKPGKPYTHIYSSEYGRLRLSQATLGSGSSTKKSIVQCNVGDKESIYLCSLLPEKLETCPLNLEFEEDHEVTFSVIGSHSVHLSGFFYGESEDNLEDDYPMGEEDFSETESESDDGIDHDSEDDDEYFIVDDDMYPASSIPKRGVRIEEIIDEEKPTSENGNKKRQKKVKNQSNQSDDKESDGRQIVVKPGNFAVFESEDDDGFPISSPSKSATIQKSQEKKNERASENVPVPKKTKNESENHKDLKRKIDAVDENGGLSRKTDQQSETLLQTDDPLPENDVKQKKKNKKKKVGKEEKIAHDTSEKSNIEEVRVADTENAEKPTDEQEKEKKKNKKNKKQESTPDAKVEQSVTVKKASTPTEAKPSQVRSFPNGLVVEELTMGKPDGIRASNGKKVSVRYIGKLKNNGKIFDSNIGKAPFKFRLGVGQVIKGWDVGVNGMRVGDKRRLTIPPSMGYGKKGAGGVIPPNAWLVFDVELVDVN